MTAGLHREAETVSVLSPFSMVMTLPVAFTTLKGPS